MAHTCSRPSPRPSNWPLFGAKFLVDQMFSHTSSEFERANKTCSGVPDGIKVVKVIDDAVSLRNNLKPILHEIISNA